MMTCPSGKSVLYTKPCAKKELYLEPPDGPLTIFVGMIEGF